MFGLPLLLAAVAAVWTSPIQADPPPPADAFVIAVVRDDGVMVPAATYENGRWRMPWPEPARETEVTVRVDDCPPAWWGLPGTPRDWTLHTEGDPPRPITLESVTWVQAYCQQQVALHSRDARRPLLRFPDGDRAPKYGVATTGSARVTVPRRLDPDSAEARALLDALQRPFGRIERLMLNLGVYRPSLGAAARDRLPIRALAIHEGPVRDGSGYFVELMRSYPRRSPKDLLWCDEVTYIAGWVRRRKNDLTITPAIRSVTSCLLDTTQRASPLAVVETPRGPAWFLELYEPDAEVLGVFRAPDGDEPEPLLIREMGRCP